MPIQNSKLKLNSEIFNKHDEKLNTNSWIALIQFVKYWQNFYSQNFQKMANSS